MVRREALKQINIEIKDIIKDILNQKSDGRIESETAIMDRFVQKLQDLKIRRSYFQESSFDYINLQLVIQIRTLGDRGKKSPESKYGADVCLVMEIDDQGNKRKKGVLIQNKINRSPIEIEHRKNTYIKIDVQSQKFNELNDQIQKMNRISDENYFLVYNNTGFYIIKGQRIMNPKDNKEIISLKAEIFEDFFERMIKCLRGDRELIDWTDDSFEELIRRKLANYLIYVKVFQDKGPFSIESLNI